MPTNDRTDGQGLESRANESQIKLMRANEPVHGSLDACSFVGHLPNTHLGASLGLPSSHVHMLRQWLLKSSRGSWCATYSRDPTSGCRLGSEHGILLAGSKDIERFSVATLAFIAVP